MNIPLHLLRVVEAVPEDWADPRHGFYINQLDENLYGEARDYLAKLESTLNSHGQTLSESVASGSVADAIVRESERDPESLVAISTYGRSGIRRWMMGSVADKVLHSISNPLLVIKPQAGNEAQSEAKLEVLIVPVDGSDLATKAVPIAGELVKGLGAALTVLRVVSPPSFPAAPDTEGDGAGWRPTWCPVSSGIVCNRPSSRPYRGRRSKRPAPREPG